MITSFTHWGMSVYKICQIVSLLTLSRGLQDQPPADGDSSVSNGSVFPISSDPSFTATFDPIRQTSLPEGIDNVAYGAYVSGPGIENRGFYFSGMRNANNSELFYIDLDINPRHISNASATLIDVDMSDPRDATFDLVDLPDIVAPRGEAAMVWLPYGSDGILVVIGGSRYPYDLWGQHKPPIDENNFTNSVAIYDIGGKTWHVQATNGGEAGLMPETLAGFCAVVASLPNGTLHSIYVYGGYDGGKGTPTDEMWVLSLPSFTWTLVTRGLDAHRRSSHACFVPNPSTMLVVGGTTDLGFLLSDTGIDVFDLNKHEWTGKYDPASTATYSINATITTNIVPAELSPELTTLLGTKYTKLINHWLPSTICPSAKKLPKWEIPVIVVCAVVAVAISGGLVFGLCRRQRKTSQSAARTEMRQNKVMSWFGRSSNAGHDPVPETSHASGDTGVTMVNETDYFARSYPKTMHDGIYEVPNSAVTSPGIYSSRNGTPYVTSPALSGSHEVDATSRHEMGSDMRGPMSIREHPAYPLSIQGEFITSARSDITPISYPSENLSAARHHGGVSPYELPQDRSNEDLRTPPDLSLAHARAVRKDPVVGKSFDIDVPSTQSPMDMPKTPVTRKPVASSQRMSMGETLEQTRPSHRRNDSSISSNIPSLPSPNPEEDRRRSRFIDGLPDAENQKRQMSPQDNLRSIVPGRISAYQENFDDNMNRRSWMGPNATM